MSMPGKILRHHQAHPDAAGVTCSHTTLTARWDRLEDIGKEQLASSFACESCRTSFSGDEGRQLLHTHRRGQAS